MTRYSLRSFIEEIKEMAASNEILAGDLALYNTLPSEREIAQVEVRLGCKLPTHLIELMTSMEISGVQLGHIEFGMAGFDFPSALIEQNLNVDDPEFLLSRGLLSIGLEVNWASPLCVPRTSPPAETGPPVLVLDHETGNVIGPIYSDFLTFLEGQAFLCGVWGQDNAIIKKGMQRILGPTLNGPAADYWREFFQTV